MIHPLNITNYPPSLSIPSLSKLGEDDFVFEAYSAVKQRVSNFASGIVDMGVKSGQQTYVGLYSINRPEWVICEQAINSMSMILVPLYDTLGPDAVKFIVNQAQISLVVADASKIVVLLKNVAAMPSVKIIVKMGFVTEEEQALAQANNVQVVAFSEVEKRGRSFHHAPVPPTPQDVATVCYTSGIASLCNSFS